MATSERGLVERLRERTAHANTEAKRLWPHDPGVLLSTHEATAIAAALSAAEARTERMATLLRMIEAGDWAGMIERAKAVGVPNNWKHTHNLDDYELAGDYAEDARYVYPTRANLTAVLIRAALTEGERDG